MGRQVRDEANPCLPASSGWKDQERQEFLVHLEYRVGIRNRRVQCGGVPDVRTATNMWT